MHQILEFLTSLEVLVLQILNQWMYTTGISRCQIRVSLSKQMYFGFSFGRKFQHTLFAYKEGDMQCTRITDMRFNFFQHLLIQVHTQLFAFPSTQKDDGHQILKYSGLWNRTSLQIEPYGKLPVEVFQFALASLTDNLIVLTGGCYQESPTETSPQACIFDLRTKRWQNLPDLNHARFNHSSMAVGGKVYVIGGALKGDFLDQLNIEHYTLKQSWVAYTLQNPLNRNYPLVCPIKFQNKDEILMLGGSFLGDAVIFDTETMQHETVIADDESFLSIKCRNQAFQSRDGTSAISIVYDNKHIVELVRYSREKNEVTMISTIGSWQGYNFK